MCLCRGLSSNGTGFRAKACGNHRWHLMTASVPLGRVGKMGSYTRLQAVVFIVMLDTRVQGLCLSFGTGKTRAPFVYPPTQLRGAEVDQVRRGDWL